MRLALIFLIVCAAFLTHAIPSITLYAQKNDMNGQDYIDRAAYMYNIADQPEEGGAVCYWINMTQAGPFIISFSFPLPNADQKIHSLSLSAIMETNSISGTQDNGINLDINHVWEPIELKNNNQQGFYQFYYESSVHSIETTFLFTEMETLYKFATVFKFFFNSTENGQNLLNVEVQCPMVLTRPKNVHGMYDGRVTTVTRTDWPSIDIDLSISATLLPCKDLSLTDVSSCTRIGITDPTPVYKLNDYGKFELFLDNSDFAGIYYLIKNKIEMKSNLMTNAADFTTSATAGPVSKGKMIFKLPMVMVGDPITVSAIATLSTSNSRRRMMDSAVPKATFATSDVSVNRSADIASTEGLSTYIISLIFILIMALLML